MSDEVATIGGDGARGRALSRAVRSRIRRTLGVLLLLLSPAAARAVDQPKPIQEKTAYERIRDLLTFYHDETNPILEALSVVGRYQGQYASVDADQGHHDRWENRRFFFGAEARLYHHWTVQAQMRTSEDFDPFYDGLYQAYVRWAPSDSLAFIVGRLDCLFPGMERTTSSNAITTIERGLVVNQVTPGEAVGAFVEGRGGAWTYHGAVLSGNIEREFTDFSAGSGITAGVGTKVPLFYSSGTLHLDYLYNDGNAGNNALKPYDQVVSLWHEGRRGRLKMGTDVTWAHGLGARPAVFGATLLPTYQLAADMIRKGDALQGVLRYQFASSEHANGLNLQSRYEQDVVPGGKGDRYQAIYGGINYLIYGDRLKLMNGLEYSDMRDSAHDRSTFSGWTYFGGVRVFF